MICEKCGFETGPAAKFCAVCGSLVMPAQMPVAAPEAEIEPVVNELVWEEASPAEEPVCEVAEEATEIQPEEIVENAAPLFEEAAADPGVQSRDGYSGRAGGRAVICSACYQ